jgi:hypothetical protein
MVELERYVPMLYQRLTPEVLNDPKIQVAAERLKQILSDMRWHQGPYLEVKVVK